MTREEEIRKASIKEFSDIAVRPGTQILRECCRLSFQQGAKWADEHPKSPWISVEDDLPYNNPNNIHFGFTNKVFAIDYNKNIFIAYMTKYNNKWVWCRDDNFDLLYIITHWMPIPKLPKE